MPDPATHEEYLRLSAERTVTEGFGLDVVTRVPCPFCAAPDFMALYPVAGIADSRPNIDRQLEAERACGECGRSVRGIVQRDGGGVSVEIVQTGGDDPPAWMTLAPRRVERG